MISQSLTTPATRALTALVRPISKNTTTLRAEGGWGAGGMQQWREHYPVRAGRGWGGVWGGWGVVAAAGTPGEEGRRRAGWGAMQGVGSFSRSGGGGSITRLGVVGHWGGGGAEDLRPSTSTNHHLLSPKAASALASKSAGGMRRRGSAHSVPASRNRKGTSSATKQQGAT